MAKRNDESKMPFWQTEPCPSWCCGHHHDSDHPDDRMHDAAWDGEVTLSLEEPHVRWRKVDGKNVEYVDPAAVQVFLAQGIRETAPRIQLSTFIVDHTQLEIPMTIAEARKLVRKLNKAIRLGESA